MVREKKYNRIKLKLSSWFLSKGLRNIERNPKTCSLEKASTVGVSMIGFDARYKYNNLELRGQYIHTNLSNTEDYNVLTGKDLGSKMTGLYGEIAYNIALKGDEKLTPFFRYEKFNTHAETTGELTPNEAYDRDELFFGLSYKVADGAAFKIDYQLMNNAISGSETTKQFNAGVAIWF